MWDEAPQRSEGGRATLDETLNSLSAIIDGAAAVGSPLGIFPAMYRSVTADVRDAVRDGFFDRGDVLEGLAVRFADRYLHAYRALEEGVQPTAAWSVTFDAARDGRTRTILQHLLAGMNAHINLDLGVVAAEIAGEEPAALYPDFLRVNEILFRKVDVLQANLGAVSPAMVWIDRLGWRLDEQLMRLGIREARDDAWDLCSRLLANPSDRDRIIRQRDQETAAFGRTILHGRSPIRAVMRVIAGAESSDIGDTVEALSGIPVDLDDVEETVTIALESGGTPGEGLR